MQAIRCLSLLALTALAGAQIPLPPFVRTYSSTAGTRGLWFQTPIPIVVTGLRVPDEGNAGVQTVEVIKLAAPPPTWSTTGTGGQVFYAKGVPSKDVIPTSLLFLPGECCCVIGGCGTTSINSSYAAQGPFQSNVLGQPITLTRFGTQFNIYNGGGNAYWQEPPYEVARIEIYVAGMNAAMEYGAGTGVGSGAAPSLTTTARPVIGQTATLSLSQSYTTVPIGTICLAIGRASIQIPALGGTILINPPVYVSFSLPAPLPVGATPLSIPIPNNSVLVSSPPIDFQAFVLVSGQFAMSNGVEWWLGQ